MPDRLPNAPPLLCAISMSAHGHTSTASSAHGHTSTATPEPLREPGCSQDPNFEDTELGSSLALHLDQSVILGKAWTSENLLLLHSVSPHDPHLLAGTSLCGVDVRPPF